MRGSVILSFPAGSPGSLLRAPVDPEYNDIYGMVQRVLRSFAVDEESLAVEVIGHVMDTMRNFLKEPHSRKYLRGGEFGVAGKA